MKRRSRALVALVLIIQQVWLAACTAAEPAASSAPTATPHSPGIPASASSLTPLPSLSSMPSLSPASPTSLSLLPSPSPAIDAPLTVKTDYSQLTPYKPPEEVYTRLSPDYIPELVPSKDYGPLLPYVGALLDAGPAYPVGTDEGLVTLDGKIVLDAVCYEIVKPVYYDEFALTYPDDTVYILKKAIEKDIDGHTYGITRYAVCARAGSWATPFKYTYVICCDRVMLLFNDLKTNDFDAMDYGGRILYNSKELDCYAQLRNYYLHKGDGPSPTDIGGGTVALWDYDAKKTLRLPGRNKRRPGQR